MKRAKSFKWSTEEAQIRAFCEKHGYTYEPRNAGAPVYQLGRITGPGFRIIAYPHTTTGTGNQHIRLRDEKSEDKAAYQAVTAAIFNRAKDFRHDCTFTSKNFNYNAALKAVKP